MDALTIITIVSGILASVDILSRAGKSIYVHFKKIRSAQEECDESGPSLKKAHLRGPTAGPITLRLSEEIAQRFLVPHHGSALLKQI